MINVLVVDDEESIRITLSEFLKDAGYAVEERSDADEALKVLSERNFDLVVTDIILPRITGVSLLLSIKTISPYVEVILMTGEPTIETASEAVRAGAFDYLQKPLSKNRLLTVLAKATQAKMLADKGRILVEQNLQYQERLEALVRERTAALQESKERLQLALEGNRDGVWDWHVPDGKVIFSDRWKEMLGYTPDEILDRLDERDKRIHPEEREAVDDAINKHFNKETPHYVHEYRVLCKDGSYKWILDRGKVIVWSKDHTPVRMLGTYSDITLRKQARMLAADQRNILELISQGHRSQKEIFEHIIRVCESYSKKTRASVILAKGDTMRPGASPGFPESYDQLIEGLKIGPSVCSCGTAMYRKERVVAEDVRTDPLWADFRHMGEDYGFRACWAEPILGADGAALGTLALYREEVGSPSVDEIHLIVSMSRLTAISIERKQAEEKIHMLSQAIEQSPVSVVITNTEAQIEYVNSAFEKLTGYRSSEVIGLNPRLLQSGKTPEHRYQALWDALTRGKAWTGEFQNQKKNGEVFWESAHIAPVLDDAGITRHYLAVKEDITLRKQQQEKLLQQAHFDGLTHLPNRFLSLDRLSQLLKEARRNKTLVSVLFLDLDDFKKVNDALGHEVGDKLLVKAAERLSLVARNGDTVGRLGGDEFIVLLGGLLNMGDVRPVVKNLLDQFRTPFEIEGRELLLTISIGVALFPEDGQDSSELLRCADSAMYHAKKLGRNTSAYFTDAMNREVSRRLILEEQMYGALERKEFFVLYQPILNLDQGTIKGAEALLRWHNPALGDVFPDEFIPVAEQTGVIVSLGQFVLNAALAMCRQMQQRQGDEFIMAVNVSPRQFRDPDLFPFIKKALAQSGVSGQNLELEITEGVLMSGHAYINDVLAALSDIGVSISMDDFGTGYSSLSYLRRYPFDVLKIDRSFVNDITVDPMDQALINASIAMAHGLGLKVVAEGVETKEQLNYLRQQDCDYAQGYFFAKAMSEEALLQWQAPAWEDIV